MAGGMPVALGHRHRFAGLLSKSGCPAEYGITGAGAGAGLTAGLVYGTGMSTLGFTAAGDRGHGTDLLRRALALEPHERDAVDRVARRFHVDDL